MGQNLLLTIRLHGDGQGTARYHGMAQGNPEWPPAPARVFQALLSGSSRGRHVPSDVVEALEWLEGLPPPVIVAPSVRRGERVGLFVPNNDADAVDDPRDSSAVRVKKVVEPSLFDENSSVLYSWLLSGEGEADAIVSAANDLYQLGRGADMAWALGEVIEDGDLELRMRVHGGTIHRPKVASSGSSLACPVVGSVASLMARFAAVRLRAEGTGKAAKILFTNSPKPRFVNVGYGPELRGVLFELRAQRRDTEFWNWPLNRVTRLVETIRDSAAERLRVGLPTELSLIERALIGRKDDGSDSSPTEKRVRIVPLPSIGHEYADRAVRRVLVQIPSGTGLSARDVEWAFSGLEALTTVTGEAAPFVLMRAESEDMLRHYTGPSSRWRSVTAVALPESARRRRIEPMRKREEAKGATERIDEERLATAAVHVALRHAGVSATAVAVRVQREPFDADGARVEAFAGGTRFAKERLWHVELELDRPLDGPLVIGDGRFLGLGVLSPIGKSSAARLRMLTEVGGLSVPVNGPPHDRSGLFVLAVLGDVKDNAVAISRALRRAVMARVQARLGRVPLSGFFTGHDPGGQPLQAAHSSHLAFHWDPIRRRVMIIAPHWLDRREPTRPESAAISTLGQALESMFELRAGEVGRFAVRQTSIASDDALRQVARSWTSLTPYAVTRHGKRSSASDLLIEDVLVECRRRSLPQPSVAVLDARGIPGRGLEGRLRLDFAVAVSGPLVLGRTRYLGGGLFAPTTRDPVRGEAAGGAG